jgi:hypothetical protein
LVTVPSVDGGAVVVDSVAAPAFVGVLEAVVGVAGAEGLALFDRHGGITISAVAGAVESSCTTIAVAT